MKVGCSYCNDPGFINADIDYAAWTCFWDTIDSVLDFRLEGSRPASCPFHCIGVRSDRTLHPQTCVCLTDERVPIKDVESQASETMRSLKRREYSVTTQALNTLKSTVAWACFWGTVDNALDFGLEGPRLAPCPFHCNTVCICLKRNVKFKYYYHHIYSNMTPMSMKM